MPRSDDKIKIIAPLNNVVQPKQKPQNNAVILRSLHAEGAEGKYPSGHKCDKTNLLESQGQLLHCKRV
jgi:hypothetical protein